MTRFSPDDPIPDSARGAAIALGKFDGVHLGHQAVLASARAAAESKGAPFAAAVFAPHPRRVFEPNAPPFRLQTPGQRSRALEAVGADHVFEIRFDHALSKQSDAEFVDGTLRRRFGISHVSVGSDFRFGRGRMGDVSSLRSLGSRFGFTVDAVSPVSDAHGLVSSSAIRSALANGAVEEAQRMLGRPWAVEGVVQPGFARGRSLGFATANLSLGDYQRPKLGIYAVRADLGDGVRHAGVASIGVNPTFEALKAPILEAHLFDFDADLYGRLIEVELISFLREEARFENAEALARQIAADIAQARKLLTLP